MRRSIFLFIILFLFSSSAFCQGLFSSAEQIEAGENESAQAQEQKDGEENKSEITYSNEHFSWKEVKNAASYYIEIKQKKGDAWEKIYSTQTSKTEVLVPLKTGSYQIVITPVNVLGKKGEPSKPLVFQVIDNTVPYIYKTSFSINKQYKKPLLFYTKKGKKYSINSKESDIKVPQGYEDNVFALSGRNIFDSDTSFELYKVKKDGSRDEKAEVIPLTVVKTDEANEKVYVSFEVEKLKNGEYEIAAKKSNGNTSTLSIHVDSEYKRDLIASSIYFGVGSQFRRFKDYDEFEWYHFDYKVNWNLLEFNRFITYIGVLLLPSNQADEWLSPEIGMQLGIEGISGLLGTFEIGAIVEAGYNLWEYKGYEENNLYVTAALDLRLVNNLNIKVGWQWYNLLDTTSDSTGYVEIGFRYQYKE
ncbi:MAG: fibronectin type III domain-containing protein [Treponema sp.]|nr:fibronectin type III domain-containing protein [Treponema sp.]